MRPERPGLRPEKPNLRTEKPNLRPERPGLRPENVDLRPEKPYLRPERPERLDMRLERPDFRPVRLDLKPERLNLRPKRPDLRSQKPDLRPAGPDEGAGGGDERIKNKQTNKRKSPCVLQDFVPFGAAAQKGVKGPTNFSTLIVEIYYHFMLKNALKVAYITEFWAFLSAAAAGKIEHYGLEYINVIIPSNRNNIL